ncbi:MAG: sigma-70 family RNA polymerase sigma factor [Flavobacteriales bacterium]|jgi:RNA polymerase sigma-70 factor (ECF subfamily)|nr:sigma-70 family RNA polymerase sigma factor [Flavobacteriales bacterium]MBK9598126.1 sigma-70 family RNA polymerase sigma factor [Flavobacteriales bacterium]
MDEHTDEELIALFRKEESRHYAFNLLVRKHQRRLYTFIRRMVTDPDETKDVLQNVFLKAWTGLDKFREDAQLYSWLYRIAHNESITHLKRMRRGFFTSDAAVTKRLVGTLDSSEHFSGDMIQRKLQSAVMTLPPKQRAVFTMKYFDELKYEEMSRVTGTSVGALKSSYHIAVKKIEAELTKVGRSGDQTL